MKTKLYHSFNFVLEEHMMEHPTGPSETIPGEVVDLASLIKRAMSGGQVMGFDDGYSDEDYPDLHQMDTIDIHTMRHENLEQIAQLQEQEAEIARELAERKKQEKASKENASPAGGKQTTTHEEGNGVALTDD